MFSEEMLLRIPALLIALTVHEYAHGWTALKFGDSTARDAGRLTLNPISHLDIFGAAMLLFGPFGWAKPVPITPGLFTRRRLGLVVVSAAGPLSNIALAVVSGLLYRYAIPARMITTHVAGFFQLFFMMNIGISFFNLLPIPPLDGSKIVMGMLPPHRIAGYLRAVRYAPQVFVVMMVAEWMLHIPVFSYVINPLFIPWFSFWRMVVFG